MSIMELAELRRTVEDMGTRLRALEEGVGGTVDPLVALGLTHSEAIILGAMLKREFCSRERLLTVLYGTRDDAPDPKCLDVFVCKIRKKLGLQIRVRRAANYGGLETGGYLLTAEDRRAIQERLAA